MVAPVNATKVASVVSSGCGGPAGHGGLGLGIYAGTVVGLRVLFVSLCLDDRRGGSGSSPRVQDSP